MKMKTISTLIVRATLLVSFIYAGSVSPMLSMRFNDVAGSSTLVAPGQAIGLKMEVGEGIYSGFDTDGTDFRIFIQRSIGSFGIGTDANSGPQFTIGGHYNIFDNLNVSFDYIVNNLTDADGAGGNTDPTPDQMRISLSVIF